jgi:tRNA pseudouridine38-40 synthase
MRYAIALAYNGEKYEGWQIQPGRPTIQSALQAAMTTLCRNQLEVVGCGRTDSGVHAKEYIAHFDLNEALPKDFVYHLNAILPQDIAIKEIKMVSDDFHARYDAISRTYEYYLHGFKSPFIDQLSFRIKQFDRLNPILLQSAADLLLHYDEFFPFCISNSNVDNYKVKLILAKWELIEKGKLKFTIKANRFLRGMVRLITGMCVNVALEQLTLEQVKLSLDQQVILPKSLSLPPHGLYLVNVEYAGNK